MANCKPCEEKGVARTALFVINGVALCPEHRTEKLLGQVKKPVDTEPAKETKKMVTEKLCHCGRPLGHRGIHRGGKLNRVFRAPRNTKILRRLISRPAATRDLGSAIISAIAELEARRDKLQKLIDDLKAL